MIVMLKIKRYEETYEKQFTCNTTHVEFNEECNDV